VCIDRSCPWSGEKRLFRLVCAGVVRGWLEPVGTLKGRAVAIKQGTGPRVGWGIG
jgi:hypothetical protein